jgi:hypothetical protein
VGKSREKTGIGWKMEGEERRHMWNGCSEMRERGWERNGEKYWMKMEIRWMKEICKRRERIAKKGWGIEIKM